jgi:SAM-dependent methyltransferase
MRELWRGFAREDPMYYVATNRRDWDAADFYEMGRTAAADVLDWAGDGIGRERMVEIGCGAGRMLIHFAPHFGRVDGLDIATEMIEAARAAGLPENVHLTVSSGADLRPLDDAAADLVLSIQVFQHIPDREVLASYLEETGRVLRPDGRAVLHFDTRAPSSLRRLAMALPDRLLPRDRRRGIRRYPVPAEWPVERARAAGLRLVDRRAPGTEATMFLFERGDRP